MISTSFSTHQYHHFYHAENDEMNTNQSSLLKECNLIDWMNVTWLIDRFSMIKMMVLMGRKWSGHHSWIKGWVMGFMKRISVVVFKKYLYSFLNLPLYGASWHCFSLVFDIQFWNQLWILASPTGPISCRRVVSSWMYSQEGFSLPELNMFSKIQICSDSWIHLVGLGSGELLSLVPVLPYL